MISNNQHKQAYVWIWLPEEISPVICGKLESSGNQTVFNYGKSYLEKINDTLQSIPIYKKELPLISGIQTPNMNLDIHSCIRDASPDAWGRRVIINSLSHLNTSSDISEITFLLESGSDRIGALDFQLSPTEYIPRTSSHSSLDELLESAYRVEKGIPLSPELDQALIHGTSIGGARPKAFIESDNKKYIAKFSSSSDTYNVIKAEYIAMRLADLSGLNTPPVKLIKSLNKDVLLVQRFDRKKLNNGWSRKSILSALTLFGLNEMEARYASYEDFAHIIKKDFSAPKKTLKELFSRLMFNILSGNTDDHARNHAAIYNGEELELTPAYDICPQARTGNIASQAMLISGEDRQSKVSSCINAAEIFNLSKEEAFSVFLKQKNTIENNWTLVCDEADLSIIDRKKLWRRQFLNEYSLLDTGNDFSPK